MKLESLALRQVETCAAIAMHTPHCQQSGGLSW